MNRRLRVNLAVACTLFTGTPSACSLKAGITMEDVEVETIGLLHAGLLLQIVMAALSFRLAQRSNGHKVVPWILAGLVILHPGLTIVAFKEWWIYRGDCGGAGLGFCFFLLLVGLLIITAHYDAVRRRLRDSGAETS